MTWVHNLQRHDPHDRIARVIGISLAFSIAAFLAVCLRFYVRWRTQRQPWVDDYAALLTAGLALGYAGIAVAQTRWGLGLSMEYFPPQNVITFSKIQYAGGPVYTLALLGFKVALLSSYLRIGGFVRKYRLTVILVIVLCVANQLIFTFLLSFACRPVAKQWDPSIPGKCINTIASYFSLAGTSLAFDIIIIALPLPVLWRLQLQMRQKLALTAIFALGFFVTVIQVIRIFTISRLRNYADSQPIVIWSIVEISLATMISCIPTYGPLFRSLAINFSSYRNRPSGPSYGVGFTRRHGTGTVSGAGNGTRSREKNGRRSVLRSGDSSSVCTYTAYQLGGDEDEPRPYDNSLPHSALVVTGKTNGRGGFGFADTESEEHMLGPVGGNLHIHTTTEVTVERD